MCSHHQRAQILPGSVLDTVITGPLVVRTAAAARLADIAWDTGRRACATPTEIEAWDACHAAYLQARLESVSPGLLV